MYFRTSTVVLDPMWTVSPYDKHVECREVLSHDETSWSKVATATSCTVSALVGTFDKNIDSKCME